ncbi:MAG: polyprenyl diphosphate synthase [Dehalococcoidia bacterium]
MRLTLSTPLYRWYTRLLVSEVSARPVPQHVALILDGNRRFARQLGLGDVTEGHRFGAEKVKELVQWCDELKIPVVTLWGLSTDNLKQRAPEELEKICQTVCEGLADFCRDQTTGTNHRRIKAVGQLELLPESLRHQIAEVEHLTAASGPGLLNIAVAYDGRDEIIDSFRHTLRARAAAGWSILEVAEQISIDDLQQYLYTSEVPPPDLIIRTSGELRLSGFLLWQSVHSELYFCDALWPAFRKIDFLRAIRNFQDRRRRFGR